MSNPSFDLITIVQTIRQRRRFILMVTLAAAIVGGLLYFVRSKKYEATTEFILINPLYGDRHSLYRSTEARYIDYYAGDEDIDHIISLSGSDTVISTIIRLTGLDSVYKVDTSKPEDIKRAKDIFKKCFDMKRTEYRSVELKFTDKNKERSAFVANQSLKVIEAQFRSFYNNTRGSMYGSIQAKLKETDSAIAVITDTLAALREQYHIYDIISPARQNIISGSIHESNVPGFGKAMEQIQNIEAVKDQLVIDKTKYVSLLNEFSTGTKMNELPLTQVVTMAKAPVDPKGPGLMLTLIASILLGLFFGTFYMLLVTYFRALMKLTDQK